MSNTALQLVENRPEAQALRRQIGGLQLNSLEDLQTIGQIFVKSGFFADATDAAKAIVKVMAGAEIGFPPISAMMGINTIKGKVSLSANLMAAAIKKSQKYSYRIKQLDDSGCALEFFENGQSVGVSSFTRQDAQAAGLLGGDNWRKFPRNMFFARAMSNGAKWYCPDVFGGGPIYTPDELGAVVDGETGEVIEIAPERVESAQPARPAPVQTPAPAGESVSAETLAAIEELWPKYGQKQGAGVMPLADYLHWKKQLTTPAEMTQEYAAKLLGWLQQKALNVADQPAEESKAASNAGAGLDQWQCTLDTGSRVFAMEILNATKRLEATGVTETEWRAELNDIPGYDQPVKRTMLTGDDARVWLKTLTTWAERNEKAKGATA